MWKSIVVVVALVAISTGSRNATNDVDECCYDIAFTAIHACIGLPAEYELLNIWTAHCWIRSEEEGCNRMCWSKFCTDGFRINTTDFQYCGIGKCNMYGCNCDGGCRRNQRHNHKELEKAWLAEHGFIGTIVVEPAKKTQQGSKKSFFQKLIAFFSRNRANKKGS